MFNNIIGYDSIKLELARIIDMINNPEKYKKLGTTTTKGVLIAGRPGVGKTTFAKDFIKACKLKSYILRKDEGSFDFSKKIKSTFREALENTPCIVYLDDIDKYSNEDMRHTNTDEFIITQSCIDDCRGKDVYVFATANDTDCLPNSLLRPGRFDKIIYLEAPSLEDSKKIVKHYLRKKKLDKNINADDVARFLNGNTCAELESVINEAGVFAGFEGRKTITMNDLIRSFLRVVFHTPEGLSERERVNKEKIAIHEAGHTVIGEVLNPGSTTIVTVKKYENSNIGGLTIQEDTDTDKYFDINEIENDIIKNLGGKAATEILLGVSDVGCSSDIETAKYLINYLIDDCCKYDFNMTSIANNYGERYNQINRSSVINTEFARYYQQAKQILLANIELLTKITDYLMEKDTITFKDIEEIKLKLGYKIK